MLVLDGLEDIACSVAVLVLDGLVLGLALSNTIAATMKEQGGVSSRWAHGSKARGPKITNVNEVDGNCCGIIVMLNQTETGRGEYSSLSSYHRWQTLLYEASLRAKQV